MNKLKEIKGINARITKQLVSELSVKTFKKVIKLLGKIEKVIEK